MLIWIKGHHREKLAESQYTHTHRERERDRQTDKEILLPHTIRRSSVFKKPETDAKSLRHGILKLTTYNYNKSDTYSKLIPVYLSFRKKKLKLKLNSTKTAI